MWNIFPKWWFNVDFPILESKESPETNNKNMVVEWWSTVQSTRKHLANIHLFRVLPIGDI